MFKICYKMIYLKKQNLLLDGTTFGLDDGV